MLTDKLKSMGLDAVWVPGKGLGGIPFAAWGATASIVASAEQTLNANFTFRLFFCKSEYSLRISFG